MNKEQFIHIKNGNKFYYSDRQMTVLHREDGPAYEGYDGHKEWWLNGKLHREDGPAIAYTNGSKAWFLNDAYLTEDKELRYN